MVFKSENNLKLSRKTNTDTGQKPTLALVACFFQIYLLPCLRDGLYVSSYVFRNSSWCGTRKRKEIINMSFKLPTVGLRKVINVVYSRSRFFVSSSIFWHVSNFAFFIFSYLSFINSSLKCTNAC